MSTAVNLSEQQLKRYAETARQRQLKRALSTSEIATYQDLMGCIEQAAQALRNNYGATRVVLFGSLAHQAWFSPESDIDLAVEGINPQDYFLAWGVVEDLIGDRQVDLVDLQDVSPSLREAINKHGKDL